ncbi:MAG TPA: glycoside hydrolase family 15 protein [Candidatus Limnocylindrales bacterium]|nr:glycoside hydrolase family 15 protein [Candidatus Limnocylindrales bacterium]
MTDMRIEDYALIGDTQTAALVGADGSIDWLCLPRFDSAACFAALVGTPDNGYWRLGPADGSPATSRRYRGDSLVLETTFETASGTVRVVDCMPPRARDPDVVRVVEGVSGRVPVRMELAIRFDYGRSIPWVRRVGGRLSAVAGPDAVVLETPVATVGEGFRTVANFEVSAGDRVPFALEWHPSHEPFGAVVDALEEVRETQAWWETWAQRCTYDGEWRDAVVRSLITLKALTYAPSGGIVAAPTTSLPEQLGGVRNWDYRYCWLRDATFTLDALMAAGYDGEAQAWRDWLLRAVAGSPGDLQIMYGCGGERRLPEMTLEWLSGYRGARPVRIGNAAVDQLQLDVFGEVMDSMHQARDIGIPPDPYSWDLQRTLMDFLESTWTEPDEGIWEVRGPRRHFTHSKVMAWVAADRAVDAVERFGLDGPADRWRALREAIRAEVDEKGWDAERGTYTQFYGSRELDASLLMLPLVGYLRADDARMQGTLAAIERELCRDGLVYRYEQFDSSVDGLPPGEGAFLACTFWLADNYALAGRPDEARTTFERLLSLRNDVGLLAEQYDVVTGRQTGNFPQAFSHVPLVSTALNLSSPRAPTATRG